MFVLALPARHLADRQPRQQLFGSALVLGAGVGIGLAAVTAAGVTSMVQYLVGTVPVGGGVITVLIAVSWRRFFPALAGVDRFQDAAPVPIPHGPRSPRPHPASARKAQPRLRLGCGHPYEEAAWQRRASSRSRPRTARST